MQRDSIFKKIKNARTLAFEYGNGPYVALFAFFGFVMGGLIVASFLFLVAIYKNHQQLDLPSSQFWEPILVLSLIAYYAGFVFRGLLIRLRLWINFRSRTIIPEYGKPLDLTAPEAGYVLNQSWSAHKVASILLELQNKGIVSRQQSTWMIIPEVKRTNLNYYQRILIDILFSNQSQVSGEVLEHVTKTLPVAEAIHASLERRGYINTKPLRQFFKVLLTVGFYCSAVLAIGLVGYAVDNGASALFTNYGPVYPFYLWQFIASFALPITLLVTALSAFMVPTTPSGGSTFKWRYVAGLKLYLKVTLEDQVKKYGASTLDTNTKRSLYPYMVAFGLVD